MTTDKSKFLVELSWKVLDRAFDYDNMTWNYKEKAANKAFVSGVVQDEETAVNHVLIAYNDELTVGNFFSGIEQSAKVTCLSKFAVNFNLTRTFIMERKK